MLAGSCLILGSTCRKSCPKKRCSGSASMVGNMTKLPGGAFSGNHVAAT